MPAKQGILGFPSDKPIDNTFPGVVVPVPVEHLTRGTNRWTFTLKRRTPGFNHDLQVTRLELDTAY